MILLNKVYQFLAALALAALLAACGTDSSSGGGSGGASDGGSSGGSGFSLRLTDAAFDAAARVDITFTEVRLRKVSGGWVSIPVNPAQKIDVAQLQGTKTAELLLDVEAEAGDYDELRLLVDTSGMANTVELTSGGVFNLTIPSGSSSGLKVKGDFSISDMRPTSLIVDIDLRQSIIAAGPNFILQPVMRLVDSNSFGHVRGIVDASLLTAPTCSDALADTFNAVYVYQGHNVSPEDIDQQSNPGTNPVATTNITYDSSTAEYIYEAAFLPPGDYTIALTCNADDENLDEDDDDLNFFNVRNITVQVNNTSFL